MSWLLCSTQVAQVGTGRYDAALFSPESNELSKRETQSQICEEAELSEMARRISLLPPQIVAQCYIEPSR